VGATERAEVKPDLSNAPPTVRRVIIAASLGTLFEWYDFYLYGALAVFFGDLFFPPGNDRAALLGSLATFGAGFVVRPLGAIVFGRIGDMIGRKYTFLVTIITMGVSTALIGFLPTYASIGIGAPILLVAMRLVQGLAIGGEYGGAATYVAEHVPDDRRGYYTSYIQTTATLGLFVSLAVIGVCRTSLGIADFKAYGWRIPFLASFILLGISLYIRIRMKESPLFARLKNDGQVSKNPIKESFANRRNLKYVLLALFGATAGQGVVCYTGQLYALTYLQKQLHYDWSLAYTLVAIAIAAGTPLFIVFGRLSDRIGRKKIMLAGYVLAALTFIPIYMATARLSEPRFIPTVNLAGVLGLLFLQMVYITMVYAPIAAFLVELFPTSIRTTSMSLPYHIGNGWFGGFLPLIATAVTTKDAPYRGLLYPIAVCVMTVIIGGLFIRETHDHRIDTPIR
jgi:MFS family permease